MARNVQQSEEDEMAEILRLALQKDANNTTDLRQRLYAAADELEISREAVAEAEAEYRKIGNRKQELELYKKESRHGLRMHFGSYVVVNLFLILVNVMSFSEDHEIWFPYVLGGWGIGMALHYWASSRKVDWDDEEFQKWRVKRAERELDQLEERRPSFSDR